MRHFYINSVIDSISISATSSRPRNWIFSCGDKFLLLTPKRLQRLAILLGIQDRRVAPLVRAVRRHSPWADAFSDNLGLIAPMRKVLCLCPHCDGVHEVHEDDTEEPCATCRRRNDQELLRSPTRNVLRERARDREVRDALRTTDPWLFHNGELSPNWQYNASRRIALDWDAAANRILMGARYRHVARDLGCSLGVLHREVQKRRQFWEDN